MVVKNLDLSLSGLRNAPVRVSSGGAYPELGCASVQLIFGNGSRLHAQYWRLIKAGKPMLSSFDHQQKYGLPAAIDAITDLQEELQDKLVTDARMREDTGDLLFEFANDFKLEVFSFTGYEDWEIQFPDNTAEYSNFVR
ncbi:MAG TPA: hypothetical protein VFW25_11045 [Silvibacterium sp.]|nr:hypothetical protein [Silvibacterium sp.]